MINENDVEDISVLCSTSARAL